MPRAFGACACVRFDGEYISVNDTDRDCNELVLLGHHSNCKGFLQPADEAPDSHWPSVAHALFNPAWKRFWFIEQKDKTKKTPVIVWCR